MKRVIFEEKAWSIAIENTFFYVEHLDCRSGLRSRGQDKDALHPTYINVDYCYWCRENFSDFILNMRTFMRWCGEW